MAGGRTQQKKFSKSQLNINTSAVNINTPKGLAPITMNLETLVSDYSNGMANAIGKFFVGDGNINTISGLKDKLNSAVGSILGAESIYSILQDIYKYTKEDHDGIPVYIKGINIKDNDIKSFFEDTQEPQSENKNNNVIIDYTQNLNKILDNTSSINTAISNLSRYYDESNKSIQSMVREFTNKMTQENGKISLMIKGLDPKSIDKLIEFAKTDLSFPTLNMTKFGNFIDAVNQIKADDVNKAADNFTAMHYAFAKFILAGKTLSLLSRLFKEDKPSENIKKISSVIGGLRSVFSTINDHAITVDKDKVDGILDSIKAVRMIIRRYTYILAQSTIYEKLNKKITDSALSNILEEISKLNTKVNGKETKTIFKGKQEGLISSINTIGLIIENIKSIDWTSAAALNPSESIDNLINNVFNKIDGLNLNNMTEDKIQKIEYINQSISKIHEIVNLLNKIKFDESLSNKTKEINNLIFGSSDKKATDNKQNDSLYSIICIFSQKWTKNHNIENALTDINKLTELLININTISMMNLDAKKLHKNIIEYTDTLLKAYEEIKSKFENIEDISDTCAKIKEANKNIKSSFDDCDELVTTTSSRKEKIDNAIAVMESMAEFMISAAAVMAIGALFTMLGGGKFLQAAIKFGATLMVFEALVILPIVLLGQYMTAAMKNLNSIGTLMVQSTIIMSIGALFMMLGGGKFVENAIKFGLLLMVFETLVITPFIIFGILGKQVNASLTDFNKFIVTSTIILTIGALFMMLGGGKLSAAALMFGVLLFEFESLIVLPFILFSIVKDKISETADSFLKFLVSATTIMMVGALFMSISNGALAKNAMAFGIALMEFEALIVAPFLLFNLIRRGVEQSAVALNSIIITSTTIMMIGALFMALSGGKFVNNALEFGFTLMAFEALVVAPFLLFNFVRAGVLRGLRSFTEVMIASTFCMTIGAIFVSGGFLWNAIIFAGGLSVFMVIMSGAMWAMSEIINDKTLSDLKSFELFMITSTAILVIGSLFIEKFGVRSPIIFASLLLGFVGLISLVMWGLSKANVEKLLPTMAALGTFIALSTISLVIGALFVEKYGWESVVIYGGILLVFVGLMGLVFAALGALSIAIIPGTIAAVALGGSLLALTGSLLIINTIFKDDKDGKNLRGNIGTLISILSDGKEGIYSLYSYLAKGTKSFILGGIAAFALGGSLMVLSSSLFIVSLFTKNDRKIRHGIETLINLLGYYDQSGEKASIYTVFRTLNDMFITITFGTVFAALLSASLLAISGSFALLNLMINKNKDLGNNIYLLQSYVKSIGDMMWEMTTQSLKILAGSTAIMLFSVPLLKSVNTIAEVLENISNGMINISKVGDLNSEKDNIIHQINSFLSIASGVDDKDIKGMKDKFKNINSTIDPMCDIISRIASTMQDIAMLKVPVSWDSKGQVTKYRHLEQSDFTIAQENIHEIITNMFTGLSNAYDSINKDTFNKDIFNRVIKTSLKIGQIISGIAQGIGDMAKLQIPMSWNENGQPKTYRQLNQHDFELAKTNIQDIITYMFNAINSISDDDKYKDMLSEGFIGLGKSKASKIINTTNDMSLMISNLARSIVDISSMKIPNDFDENGNAKKYVTLNESHFKQAGENIKTIITKLFESVEGVANDDKYKDILSSGWFGGKSKVSKIINLTNDMCTLMSNIGQSIQHIALMQIPKDWDKKTGIPIEYVKLTETDFENAAKNVGTIITALSTALLNNDIKDKLKSEDLNKIINNIMPASELISNISDSIQKISNNQIPVYVNGKLDSYTTITDETYTNLGTAVANIAIAIPKAIIDLKQSPEYVKLFSDNTIYEIIDHLSNTGELISNITDSVVNISKSQIPEYENGKIKGYKDIDFTKVSKGLGTVIGEVMTAISTAIIEIYTKNPGLFNSGNGSKLNEAITAVSQMTSILTDIIDPVIKLSSSQIPVYKDGKIDYYQEITPSKIISDIKTLFGVDNSNDGILTILFTVVKNTINTIKDDNNLEKNIEKLLNYTNRISELIGKSSSTIVDFASLNVPTKFKDGKPSEYSKLSANDITEAKTNMLLILNSLFDVVNQVDKKQATTEKIDELNSLISNINKLVVTIINGLNPILEYRENIKKILSYQSKQGISIIGIPIFDDIYSILSGLISIVDGNNIQVLETKLNSGTLDTCIGNVSSFLNLLDIITSHDFHISESNIDNIITDVNTKINKYISIKETIDTLISNIVIDNKKKYTDAINNIKEFNNQLINIYNNINNLSTRLQSSINFETSIDNQTQVDLISSFITRMVNNANAFNNLLNIQVSDEINDSLFTYMINGISSYNNVISKFNDQKSVSLHTSLSNLSSIFNEETDDDAINGFIRRTEAIDKYVTSINSVQVSKFDTLRKLVHELNILSSKMGNLDNLTTVISDKLYAVLENLVASLNNSSDVITKAENIQETRHAKIKEAMNEIRNIMNQELIVKVSSDTTEQLDDNQSSGGSGSFSRKVNQSLGNVHDRWMNSISLRGSGGNGGQSANTENDAESKLARESKKQTNNK